ncbi:MAG: type IV pilus assembly protein PilY1 [Comamonadaceae bacterium]|nr:MAG: type IV pilus assembly protein PilY1 [Comamonadaceae bacterium]
MKSHTSTHIQNFGLKRTLATLMCLQLASTAVQGQQLTLSKAPPVGGSGAVAVPNVIVTVDDSGSMGSNISGTNVTKMNALKSALKATFGDTSVIPDGRIRLAWQSMHDNGNFISNNGAKTIKLGAKNSMKLFSGSTSGTHRSNFAAFVDSLTPNNYTPSLQMFQNVFEYMNAPENPASPWADDPTATTAQSTPYLACRKTFHIFMTDGLWNIPDQPGCTNGGKRVGTTEPPVCSNSTYTCPTSSSAYTSTNSNLACKKKIKKKNYYADKVASPNTSVWSYGDRVANGDGVAIAQLPDDYGTPYDINSPMTRIYRDAYGDNPSYASTLSDFAFNNWARDLQDGNDGVTQTNSAGQVISGPTQDMENLVSTSIKVDNVETVIDPVTRQSTDLSVFWNPQNDPATWQHITQYTIGFGAEATSWGTAPRWDTAGNNTYAGDYAKLVNGTVTWPDVQVSSSSTSISARAAELWHAAINGRGKYIPAVTGDALTQAFKDILVEVLKDNTKPLITVTTSSSMLRTGTQAYVAGYIGKTWSGQLMARELDATDGSIKAGTLWDAVANLDARTDAVTNRVVISSDADRGFSWATYSTLPAAQKTQLNKNSAGTVDNNGQKRFDFIRGDRSNEVAKGGILRDRGSILGDIVNSNIWYIGKPSNGYYANNYASFRGTATGGKGGRTPMIYLGANDGMLHGVAATTTATVAGGTELLAYIPQGIAEGKLRNLTDTNYQHDYFVDGTPFSGDAFITPPSGQATAWTSVLVGSLGAGGKGYFILDVTDPAAFTAGNAANLVIKDTTGGTVDADIGVITSQPVADDAISNKSRQIVQMNDGRWAAVLGNGYNSTNEAPVLLIQYLDGDKSLKKLSACSAPIGSTSCSFKGGNGLSSPELIDINGDGRVDVAYAGDLKGNLWRFNLTSSNASNWDVSFNKQPFFVAKGHSSANARPSATVTQSITSAPYWMAHPKGGIMVAVGTGRNLTDADQSSTGIDSYYALWDNSRFSTSGGTVTITDGTPINTTSSTELPTTTGGLVAQTITGNIDKTGYYSSSNNPVNYSTSGTSSPRGWYMDLVLSTGERVLSNTRLFSGQTIIVTTTIPKKGNAGTVSESCTSSNTVAEANFLYLLNMFTGKQPGANPFDVGQLTTGNTSPNIMDTPAGDTAIVENAENGDKAVVPSNCEVTSNCVLKDIKTPKLPGRRANWRRKL